MYSFISLLRFPRHLLLTPQLYSLLRSSSRPYTQTAREMFVAGISEYFLFGKFFPQLFPLASPLPALDLILTNPCRMVALSELVVGNLVGFIVYHSLQNCMAHWSCLAKPGDIFWMQILGNAFEIVIVTSYIPIGYVSQRTCTYNKELSNLNTSSTKVKESCLKLYISRLRNTCRHLTKSWLWTCASPFFPRSPFHPRNSSFLQRLY